MRLKGYLKSFALCSLLIGQLVSINLLKKFRVKLKNINSDKYREYLIENSQKNMKNHGSYIFFYINKLF